MIDIRQIELGDKVRCINDEGWRDFVSGGIYQVTSIWKRSIDLDLHVVADIFFEDFEMEDEE